MSPKRPLYPGQLPAFRFDPLPKSKMRTKRIRPNRIRSDLDKHRAATRISMTTLRRQKHKEFDYEAYQAAFAKRYGIHICSLLIL